jgi:hypothetical protein
MAVAEKLSTLFAEDYLQERAMLGSRSRYEAALAQVPDVEPVEYDSIDHVRTTVKEFLLTEQRCPPDWRPFDLYLFRDDAVVFYVGQSYVAFDRVWRHILDGYKGRSVVGRFILCNWPASMRFTIELLSSRAPQFAELDHDLNAAERRLIESHAPCFNVTLNSQPTPLPARYAPPGQRITSPRSLTRLINEASMAVRADRRRG